MPKETILLIEDEKNIAELVKYNLEQAGFKTLWASKGDTGLELVSKNKPNLIILDLMLPEIDGLEVCKILKRNDKTTKIPIIMLTAKSEVTDKIVGLELGADDYVTKPFSPKELVARVRAVLRRGKEEAKDSMFKAGTLSVDVARHKVSIKDAEIDLASKEYDLLIALMEAKGRVLSREFLLNQVWGYDSSLNIETRTVDMHVGLLRKKLKTESARIVTIKNVGYRFDYDF